MLLALLFRIQHRCIGCRFAPDNNGNIAIVSDVYPGFQTSEGLSSVLTQMVYIGDITLQLIEQVLKTGKRLTDDEIDKAFGIID